MSNFIVKNLRGTSGKVCMCGSWLDHWYNATGSRRSTCSVLGCSGGAEVGAHVLEVTTEGGNNRRHWIVPMCNYCNQSGGLLAIDIRVTPISANTQLMGCYAA